MRERSPSGPLTSAEHVLGINTPHTDGTFRVYTGGGAASSHATVLESQMRSSRRDNGQDQSNTSSTTSSNPTYESNSDKKEPAFWERWFGGGGKASDAKTEDKAAARGIAKEAAPRMKPAEATAKGMAAAPEGTTRDQVVTAYASFLEARAGDLGGLDGKAATARANGLLFQLEVASAKINKGELIDVKKLPTAPTSVGAAQGAFVPPELIQSARAIVDVARTPENKIDWNSRLGVPTYRSQTDNLIGPEVTCGPTTMAMVMERLGISRDDVVAAIEKQLKTAVLKKDGKKVTDEALAEVTLPDDAWSKAVQAHLKKESGSSKQNYQKPLEVNRGTERQKEIAGEFKGNAQMEDLVDLLRSMLNINRLGITGADEGDKLFKNILDEKDAKPKMETLWSNGSNWKQHKEKVAATLQAGGAAVLSIYHKGPRKGGHLVTVQSVTSTGVRLDDPYGGIKPGYADGKWGDAYNRNLGASKDSRNRGDTSDKEDWKRSAGNNLDAKEKQGDSSVLSDKQLDTKGFVFYIQLYNRGKQLAPTSVPRPRPRPER